MIRVHSNSKQWVTVPSVGARRGAINYNEKPSKKLKDMTYWLQGGKIFLSVIHCRQCLSNLLIHQLKFKEKLLEKIVKKLV